jgi:hypothetical protein
MARRRGRLRGFHFLFRHCPPADSLPVIYISSKVSPAADRGQRPRPRPEERVSQCSRICPNKHAGLDSKRILSGPKQPTIASLACRKMRMLGMLGIQSGLNQAHCVCGPVDPASRVERKTQVRPLALTPILAKRHDLSRIIAFPCPAFNDVLSIDSLRQEDSARTNSKTPILVRDVAAALFLWTRSLHTNPLPMDVVSCRPIPHSPRDVVTSKPFPFPFPGTCSATARWWGTCGGPGPTAPSATSSPATTAGALPLYPSIHLSL